MSESTYKGRSSMKRETEHNLQPQGII